VRIANNRQGEVVVDGLTGAGLRQLAGQNKSPQHLRHLEVDEVRSGDRLAGTQDLRDEAGMISSPQQKFQRS